MAKNRKQREIKVGALTTTSGRIPLPAIPQQEISFSFKYLDLSKEKFSLAQCADVRQYVEKLLERFRAINTMTALALRTSGSGALRCHTIPWERTSEREGFTNLNETLRRQNEPIQFQVSANEHGRVHGFFIGSTFYVVWLDPAHLLHS